MTLPDGTVSDARGVRDGGDADARSGGWGPGVAVLALFLAYAAICRPVPSINEPHYLAKARHFWDPAWCAGDFFLESSNPHRVFYLTIGRLTRWLTLEQSAWAGRVMALSLLAWGWTRLMSRLSDQRWGPLSSACLFLLLQSLGNFSGEWLVGGVESKVFAYAFAFSGWASLIDRRPIGAGLWLGLAMAFHPVVGGWCVIAVVLAGASGWLFPSRIAEQEATVAANGLGRWLAAIVILAATSLPGLIPAIQSLGGSSAAATALADRYQVGTRLAHHLDPMVFPVADYRYYGLLLLLWMLIRHRQTTSAGGEWFVRVVAASLAIALVGILVGWGRRPIQEMSYWETRVWLLKFYPFRLADVLVPMLVAVTASQSVFASVARSPAKLWRRCGGGIVAATAFGVALWIPSPDKNPSRMSADMRRDWLAACEWIRTELPPDVLLYAANEEWAVKWFCECPEYVDYKDCPQDAAGILEWVRRLQTLNRWHRDAFRDGRLSTDELQQLHEQTGITHLLVSRLGPIDSAPAYRNGSFRVYAIRK